MAEHDYAEFVDRALFLDRPDPVAAWRELSDRQQALVERLAEHAEIRIEADGTDLRLRSRAAPGSTPTGGATCRAARCSPGPLEDSAEGTIRFTIPSSRAASRSRTSS